MKNNKLSKDERTKLFSRNLIEKTYSKKRIECIDEELKRLKTEIDIKLEMVKKLEEQKAEHKSIMRQLNLSFADETKMRRINR